jgi:hypothetical protein
MTETIYLINLLDTVFTTSFLNTARVRYSVDFTSSGILHSLEKLAELEYNYVNGINTGLNNVATINLDDICLAKDTLTKLKLIYERNYGISAIPSSLKIWAMIKDLRMLEKDADIKTLAKQVVLEILEPRKSEVKLSKKQKIEELALQKSQERKLEIIRKLGKRAA